MHVIGFNGSPRKTWNTATLLKKALSGAAAQGAETTLVHLYDLDYKGCRSCFGCKLKGGPSYGECAMRDDLTPILEQVAQADALVLGSPIYYSAVTGEMKSFMERLMFPHYRYARPGDPVQSLFPRTIATAFIYTMNAPEPWMKAAGYDRFINWNETYLKRIFGRSESLVSCDTYQFDDYGTVDQERFDPEQKAARRAEHFPLDCQKAYALGERLADGA